MTMPCFGTAAGKANHLLYFVFRPRLRTKVSLAVGVFCQVIFCSHRVRVTRLFIPEQTSTFDRPETLT